MNLRHAVIPAIFTLLFFGTAYWLIQNRSEHFRANISRDMLKMTASQIEKFFHDRGCYPNEVEFLQMAELGYWTDEMIVDMWGRCFVYEPHDCRNFTLRCLGRDGVLGGNGFDADLEVKSLQQ